MGQAWLGRVLMKVLIVAIFATGAPLGAVAESENDIDALNRQVVGLGNQGKFKEAVTLAEEVLSRAERRLGKENPHTLQSVYQLAVLYERQIRYAEAELLYRRALKARERVLGKDHPDTLLVLNRLAVIYHTEGRYKEAEFSELARFGDQRAVARQGASTHAFKREQSRRRL